MLQKLLTTDELLEKLTDPIADVSLSKHIHYQKKKWTFYTLWGIVILAVLHLVYLSLPLILGIHNTVNILGSARVIGIPYIEGVVTERPGEVIIMGQYQLDQITENDFVMVYGLVDTNYYWEVEIKTIDSTNQTFTASYDGVYEETYSYDDIYGVFERDANSIGVFIYVSSQWRGLLATFAVYASIIGVYYSIIYKEMKLVVKKEDNNEAREES